MRASRVGRFRFLVTAIALCVAPATVGAQQVANARAGVPPIVAPAPVGGDTVTVDSIAPHRSRGADAVAGAIIGTIAGGVAGGIDAQIATRHCKGDLCGLDNLAIPFFAAIGLVVGTVAGAVWPTH